MQTMKAAILPMDSQHWEDLGVKQEKAPLFTIISVVKGDILEVFESKRDVTLTEMLDLLSWPEPIVIMGVGGLISDGLIEARRNNTFILLSNRQ